MNTQASGTTFLKGHFLMAMPALADPNFEKSVTCIAEHGQEGALGIIVNRLREPINGRIIFDELGITYNSLAEQIPVYVGGPVHPDELFILHGMPLDWGGSLIIADNLALSNSRSILEAIAIGEGPRDFVISLGFAGWGPGQLEYEIGQNVWLSIAASHDIIFSVPVEERWDTAIRRLGIDPQLISGTAGHA
jgi:putative transcriptional regulator